MLIADSSLALCHLYFSVKNPALTKRKKQTRILSFDSELVTCVLYVSGFVKQTIESTVYRASVSLWLVKVYGAPWRTCVNIIFHCFRVYSWFVLTPPGYSIDLLQWGVIWLTWPATVGCHLILWIVMKPCSIFSSWVLSLSLVPFSIFYPLECKDKWLLAELQKDGSFVYCVW